MNFNLLTNDEKQTEIPQIFVVQICVICGIPVIFL